MPWNIHRRSFYVNRHSTSRPPTAYRPATVHAVADVFLLQSVWINLPRSAIIIPIGITLKHSSKYPLGTYLGIYPGKYPDKYPECIYLKAFTFSLLPNLENHAKFEKIWTKMGNHPVGTKLYTPKVNTWVYTFYVNTQDGWRKNLFTFGVRLFTLSLFRTLSEQRIIFPPFCT